MGSESPLSSVNVVLVMAFGSLVFVLLFIFVKRQIMRLAMKSRRGPHVPIGHNAPKELRQEIEAKLCQVQKVHFEPRLLSPEDERPMSGCCDYQYRMRALDAIRDTDFPFCELGGSSSAVTGKRFRAWLLQLRNSHCLFRESQKGLIDTVLDGYNKARHGAEAFGEAELFKYQDALCQLASAVKSQSSSNTDSQQHHQTAAKDLTAIAEPVNSSHSSRTHLTTAAQQRIKRTRNLLELKNFKDKYNTLDSTL
ncbi:protein C1orf43 homolog isoform X1 [Entelurus aequoreus]|uniref:protein C1orf43 homolog isoform X1 n=1 Tax=Entelurus aequoreus TaxID=161455 RepID=UPI002B1D979C|nr:protein C1orf43 homolog isoform X1 [Entelurus aequoreus]